MREVLSTAGSGDEFRGIVVWDSGTLHALDNMEECSDAQ